MTPDQTRLAIWGGGTGAVLIIGLVVLGARGETLDSSTAEAAKLHQRYVTLYHPDTAKDGIPAQEAERVLLRAQELQAEELDKAQAALVPELRGSYVEDDLTRATGQLQSDQQTIRGAAQARKVGLPATLPYAGTGFDMDPGKRAQQLAHLYLYRAVLDQCINARVSRVHQVQPDKAELDPSRSYMLLTCLFDVEASYESGQELLRLLQQSNRAGIGVSAVSIEQGGTQQRLRFTASLITPARAALGGEPPKASTTAAPAGAVPAAAGAPATTPPPTRRPGGRLGG